MNRATTLREALMAELVGDVTKLIDRLEALPNTLVNAREEMREAAFLLDSRVEPFMHQMRAAVDQSKAIAIKDIRVSTYEFAADSIVRQREAMTEAARTIVKEEVTPTMRQFAATLKGLVDQADRPWRTWLTHGAAVFASAAGTTFLLVHYFSR